MAKKLKADFENVEVSVNSKTLGRIKVNTSDEDVMKWSEIPAFAFMFEGNEVESKLKVINYKDMDLDELREMFPDIKARSKKDFIEKISV